MGRPGGIRLKYLHAFKDKTGKERYYFRRFGKRTALPGLPGSTEFMAAYAACLDQKRRAPQIVPTGTFSDLARLYFGSPHYLALAPSSRMNYRRVIETFLTQHGHRLVRQMTRAHAITISGGMADRPGAAGVLMKRLHTLLEFAVELGWIDANPTHRLRAYRSTEFHTWTEEEIAQFEVRWKIGSKQRLAFALLLYTGQRGSDVHRMTWRDITGDKIRVVQKKTQAKLSLALHPSLQEILAVTKRENVAILATMYGQPFTVKGFGQFMSDAIRGAGLPDQCKAHGLRKAAARRLAEAGCTEKEIGAVTGHKTLAEIERYTRAANQERLSRQAVEKQAANGGWQTETNQTGKTEQFRGKSRA